MGGLGPRQLAGRVWQAIGEHSLLERASDLAYNSLLAIFPALLLLLALFALSASHGAALEKALTFFLSRILPPSSFLLLQTTIAEASKNSGGAKVTVGLVIALWAALSGMTSMISALNAAYRVQEKRSWWKVRGIALALTLAISALLLAAMMVVLLGNRIADFAGAVLHLEDMVVAAWKILQWIVALGFIILSFSLIYYFGPDVERRRWHWLTPGSVLGVLLWFAAAFGFRAYLHFFNTYGKTYGSLGAAIILMVWLYVAGFAFLIGGEIDAAIHHAAEERALR
jgi:membrane protein